jgi:hypothetical protein
MEITGCLHGLTIVYRPSITLLPKQTLRLDQSIVADGYIVKAGWAMIVCVIIRIYAKCQWIWKISSCEQESSIEPGR